jgi:hypothetical protein
MLFGASVFEIRDIQEDERRGANEAIRMKEGSYWVEKRRMAFSESTTRKLFSRNCCVVGMLTCNVYFWSASTSGGNCRRSNSLATDYGGRGGTRTRMVKNLKRVEKAWFPVS